MSSTIRDNAGRVRGHWVAKTVRGFNRKQIREMAEVRKQIAKEQK